MIAIAELDLLAARRDVLLSPAPWRLPEQYQAYIEYHGARQRFESALARHWPAIRAAFAVDDDQRLMMFDDERIPSCR